MSLPVSTHHPRASGAALALGALGVVYGDIGTSPLYTLRLCLHATAIDGQVQRGDILGLLSLIFWALTLVVTVKYLTFVMRADNHGEGGIFALLALLPKVHSKPGTRLGGVALLVVIGAALLYGDGAITPAISVLSAIEGLTISAPGLTPLVVPLTCAILIALFAIQKRGTGAVGKLFGPVMIAWFVTIGALGAYHLTKAPGVLAALSPVWAVRFFATHGTHGFLVLGSVVLAVTGGEALYADMGHFGVHAIRRVWLLLVMPALLLCYFGQGSMVLSDPAALENPFFSMVPMGAPNIALVILSSAATVIASQALISGAFSLTRQAMQLGYFPRMTVTHTARDTEGQIYVPQMNWMLAAGCVALVLGFGKSDHLASAYGIAVTGTMAITSIAYFFVTRETWHWAGWKSWGLLVLFLAVDLPFFGANAFKIKDGGWVPVLIGVGFVTAMLIWNRGRTLMFEQFATRFPVDVDVLAQLRDGSVLRTPGAGVFMASSSSHLPPVMMLLVERQHTLPTTVVLVTVTTESTPTVSDRDRYTVTNVGEGIHRVVARHGFMEHTDVPAALTFAVRHHGLPIDVAQVTYYIGRERLLATHAGKMGRISESLFAWLARNSVPADQHFHIPPLQVIELGVQLDL